MKFSLYQDNKFMFEVEWAILPRLHEIVDITNDSNERVCGVVAGVEHIRLAGGAQELRIHVSSRTRKV